MSKKITWHRGPPPSVGWWPANYVDSINEAWPYRFLRWWDGKQWSHAAAESDSASRAAMFAEIPPLEPKIPIRWTNRPASWPARSRT